MFNPIIPPELDGDNRRLAVALVQGHAGDPYAEAAVGMMLRLPPELVFRRPIVRGFYPLPVDGGAVRVWWAGLHANAADHRLPVSMPERAALLAVCWVSGQVQVRFSELAAGLAADHQQLFLRAIQHAVARADQLAAPPGQRVRGTEDGTGDPVPAGVEGHPVNGRAGTADTAGGAW